MNGLAVDPRSGLAIPQARVGFRSAQVTGVGVITYRCHTCGESIVKPWETFFVDPEPSRAWASTVVPATYSPTMTTHHDWHMAATQED